jgi:hypothetical protein
MEWRNTLWVLIGFSLLGMLGCGNSRLTAVSLSPAVANAQNFPGEQVQFSATGTFGGSSKPVPLTNVTWCIGTPTGMCNGNIAAPASVDAKGLAHCNNIAAGTVTVIAGKGGPPPNPDGGRQLTVYGTAQLICP